MYSSLANVHAIINRSSILGLFKCQILRKDLGQARQKNSSYESSLQNIESRQIQEGEKFEQLEKYVVFCYQKRSWFSTFFALSLPFIFVINIKYIVPNCFQHWIFFLLLKSLYKEILQITSFQNNNLQKGFEYLSNAYHIREVLLKYRSQSQLIKPMTILGLHIC